MRLPSRDQIVALTLPDGDRRAVRVVDVGTAALHLALEEPARPSLPGPEPAAVEGAVAGPEGGAGGAGGADAPDPEAALAPLAGDRVQLHFGAPGGLYRLPGQVRLRPGGVLELRPEGEPDRVQRRAQVRAPVALRAAVALDPEAAGVPTTTHDVSGGGVRLADAVPDADGPLWLDLDVGDQLQRLRATVHVVRRGAGGTGVAFAEIAERDRDRLVRVVFAELRRAAALGVRIG